MANTVIEQIKSLSLEKTIVVTLVRSGVLHHRSLLYFHSLVEFAVINKILLSTRLHFHLHKDFILSQDINL